VISASVIVEPLGYGKPYTRLLTFVVCAQCHLSGLFPEATG
jgi:hypothetical protein